MATATADIVWDGRVHPYMPPERLSIHPALELYPRVEATVDPIDHEVLRHALWNVNVEHGNVLMRISGSPICAYGHDFNPAILDGEGNFIFFGPFLQYLAANISAAVKWTLENRSANPGIRPGDMFLFNDPWIGCSHQSDAGVIAPVFVAGKLIAWVGTTLHQWDMGGTVPGGFNPMAEDHYWESPLIPPVRIVEGGEIRRDIAEHYTRMSRLPGRRRADPRPRRALWRRHAQGDGAEAPGRLRAGVREAPGDHPRRDLDRGGLA
jgi:N-methylhydantoinase B